MCYCFCTCMLCIWSYIFMFMRFACTHVCVLSSLIPTYHSLHVCSRQALLCTRLAAYRVSLVKYSKLLYIPLLFLSFWATTPPPTPTHLGKHTSNENHFTCSTLDFTHEKWHQAFHGCKIHIPELGSLESRLNHKSSHYPALMFSVTYFKALYHKYTSACALCTYSWYSCIYTKRIWAYH